MINVNLIMIQAMLCPISFQREEWNAFTLFSCSLLCSITLILCRIYSLEKEKRWTFWAEKKLQKIAVERFQRWEILLMRRPL